MQKISPGVYAETAFHGCNVGFVVTNKGVVMIDTPMWPTEAIGWRDEIAKYGTVRYLINTEPHRDHFSGNYLFKCPIVAHEGTRDAILSASVEEFKENIRQTDPNSLPLMKRFSYQPPSITLSERLTLYLGDHTFQLISVPGHTAFQVAVHIPEERVIFTSDNIFCRVPAWLHQALPYEWLESLKRIQELEADVLVPGHGSICDKSYIPEMISIIQSWIDAVATTIDRGMNLEEAIKEINLLDQHQVNKGDEQMAQMVQRMNITRLYEVLKK